jgi:hypothetical protein
MKNINNIIDYYIVAHVKKSLQSLFTLTIAWGIARSPRSGIPTWIKSDFRLICGYFFVTGNHNKTENELLAFKHYNNMPANCQCK